MKTRLATATIERAQIDLETGDFPMVLATDGEAIDGDILSIEGMQFPERAPLQNAHMNEAKSTLGSITGFRRDLKASPKKLRARGQIELQGDGSISEIRRDIAFMISKGHITGVSVRWQPVEWIRRTALPKDHPAYVDEEREKDWRKRYGLFYKRTRVLEGSIAPVQADPASIIGRADETEGHVSAFWRSLADDLEERKQRALERPDPDDYDSEEEFMSVCIPVMIAEGNEQEQAIAQSSRLWQEREAAAESDLPIEPSEPFHEPPPPSRENVEAAAVAYLRELVAQGIEPVALLTLANETLKPEPTEAELLRQALGRIDALEHQLSERSDPGRVPGEPAPPPSLRTTQAMFDYLDSRMRATNEKALAMVQAVINVKRGKIVEGQTPRERMKAEAEALLTEMRKAEEPETTGHATDLSSAFAKLDQHLERARKQAHETLRSAAALHAAESRAHTARESLKDTLRTGE